MNPYLGQIQLFALDFVPHGWATCDGALLQISANPPLFALLGTRFGGDGRVTFGLPDMQGKEPIPNTAYCICTAGGIYERP